MLNKYAQKIFIIYKQFNLHFLKAFGSGKLKIGGDMVSLVPLRRKCAPILITPLDARYEARGLEEGTCLCSCWCYSCPCSGRRSRWWISSRYCFWRGASLNRLQCSTLSLLYFHTNTRFRTFSWLRTFKATLDSLSKLTASTSSTLTVRSGLSI